jgi:ribonucleoside-diphosphate reductase alpha chain
LTANNAPEKTQININVTGLGLKVDRVYTTPGMHPYDEVSWERRKVVQTNWRTQETVFSQSDVEFPDFWSLNASTIVTTKYFRGALDTEEREWSLKQVIDRVVGKYVFAAREHGYMDDENALIFEHELTWMLLHQVFSFNSPVWFNVGTTSPQQVSACQPYHSLVSTPAGLVPIGKLVEDNAIGTKVYDAKGLTEILAVKDNGVREVFRITTKAGHQLDVTSDHLIWKATDGEGRGAFVPAGTLGIGDMLSWHRQEMLGDAEHLTSKMHEAALAGWMQSDGFVGQYSKGTNRSLTMEAMTINQEELDWVQIALDGVFGNAHRHERLVETQDPSMDCRRTRLYGEHMRPFISQYGLMDRKLDMVVPEEMFTAPLPVVANYIRSVFQAEGFVSARSTSTLVAITMISEKLIRGIQALLLRFGIFSRVLFKKEPRPNRYDTYSLNINNEGDRKLFEEKIGFISQEKRDKLSCSFAKPGLQANATKRLSIASIESLGMMNVYDIQTRSGEYLSGNIRVHNCFILSVDDTMDSILNWYREEGMIFKGGSGAGVNISRLRSSRELLRQSGGRASGPVSFMRGADASAGAIKSGGATRRAAKMVLLDVDHPDIEEFVETKSREEHKIRALRDAGFDMDLDGQDIASVQFQNANNSVRVSDKFMKAVEQGGSFDLIARVDKHVVDTIDARALWRKIAIATWECADPGVQYDDTINLWHTNPETGRINASNPCAEYHSLDNSSCNLASLNLMKFRKNDGSFDHETFTKATEIIITAMEISISFADFPTPGIAKTTHDYRQLGIGYANLGALLMSNGTAYDSAQGRALAGSITSLMTAVSYRRSAEIAGIVGAYAGYKKNATAHKKVMGMHRNMASQLLEAISPETGELTFISHDIVGKSSPASIIAKAALDEWDAGISVGNEYGWRNSQASVLAPTGTISFMMDCDTTGVEPDFALVKFKKLVGGGSMKIINSQVDPALRSLGYQNETIEAIEAFIAEHGHIINAPGLKTEHYSVFDCAIGDRAISPNGHIRMMAAVQPFISGAISKTVNLPETATVEDIENVYYEGWVLGLKAIAVYRDNCKVGQPLSDGRAKAKVVAEPTTVDRIVERIIEKPARRSLPAKRQAETISFDVAGAEGYLTVGLYEDGKVGEVFVKMSKQGSTLAGIMDGFSIAISMGLQYGVPLEAYISKFANMQFEPRGMTSDPEVKIAQSLFDYIFRRLAVDHLSAETREGYGIYTTNERIENLNQEERVPAPATEFVESQLNAVVQIATQQVVKSENNLEAVRARKNDAPLCVLCGVPMKWTGACAACELCGRTNGCS